MGTETKGRAWFGKMYNKLEMIFMEMDTFTSQSTFCLKSSDSSEWDTIIGELEKHVEDPFSFTYDLQQHDHNHNHNRLAFPTCDPPSLQNFHIPRNVQIKKRVEEDCFKENLSASFGEICPGNLDDGKSDVASLDTIAFQENPLYVDDNALYALCVRTKKLRSFKRKILDVLNSKRRREKEYEQLAIWFGDANMGSDLVTEEDSKQVEAIDSKSSQVLESDDSQWELL